jgi:hypothetical protein
MNVLLIQPPEPDSEVHPKPLFRGYRSAFGPAWSTLCLSAYITGHSRHTCRGLDLRLHDDLETCLPREIDQTDIPAILVIHCRTDQAGEVQAIVSCARKHRSNIPIALCGPFPTRYPQHAMDIDGVDYALSGDPEAILRNLLDFIDIPQRLQNTPGLQQRNKPLKPPHWLKNIETLSLPDWKGFFWGAYRNQADTIIPEARLSRGSPSGDRSNPVPDEPLRVWNMRKLAHCIHQCSHVGISQVMLSDPPSFWTAERLRQWCTILRSMHNAQAWGIRLHPMSLDEQAIDDLIRAGGRRIDFILPTLHRERRETYGIQTGIRETAATVKRLEAAGIETHLHILIGGPEEGRDEIENLSRAVHQLAFARIILSPYPFVIGSSLHTQVTSSNEHNCTIEHFMKWVHSPWTHTRPTLTWAGQTGTDYTIKTIQYFQRSMQRNPKRILRRLCEKVKTARPITYLEDKALALLIRNT